MSTYNGWKNWETWNVSLWINNDEGLYHAMRDQRPLTASEARAAIAELLPNGTPDMDGTPTYDSVDWEAIAESVNEE